MKRNYLKMAFVCLFTVVAICSCKKDDDDETGGDSSIKDNTFTVVVENGNSYNELIDVVKLELDEVQNSSTVKYSALASAEYKNGGFTLTLPASVSSQYLEPLDDSPDGVTVSNRNVKFAWINLSAYKSDSDIGYFYVKSGDWKGGLMYADSNVSITGTETESDEKDTYTTRYSMNLKKGWNIVYTKGNNRIYEITTTAPAGAKWYFESYD
jgi:hypothetical protein